MNDFYDRLSPFYHLIYEDWEASVSRQSKQLSDLIHRRWGAATKSILDVSCGIGTQSLGLASLGFRVTASDLSPAAISRAEDEARSRGLDVAFSVCDMRRVDAHHEGEFDVVLSADNSIPHLLCDDDILEALRGMHTLLRAGGGCIVTVRDYEDVERGRGVVKPYGVRDVGDTRYLIWQVWDFDGDRYDLSMYFVEDDRQTGEPRTHVMRSRYYAIGIPSLLGLMTEAGFEDVERFDDVFFQPVLVGTKRA